MNDSNPPRVFGRRKDPFPAENRSIVQNLPSKPAITKAEAGAGEGKNRKSASAKIADLLKTPWNARDGRWNHNFVTGIPDALFHELYPQIVSPEGHRVYAVTLAEAGAANAMKFSNMVKKATQSGLGIALFTAPGMEPDFVFKHGQLTPVITEGVLLPLSTRPGGGAGEYDIEEGTPYLVSDPAPPVLPHATRAALREWLDRRYGIVDMRICLRIDLPAPDAPVKTLALDFGGPAPAGEELRELMKGICWYLPPDIAAGTFSGLNKKDYFLL